MNRERIGLNKRILSDILKLWCWLIVRHARYGETIRIRKASAKKMRLENCPNFARISSWQITRSIALCTITAIQIFPTRLHRWLIVRLKTGFSNCRAKFIFNPFQNNLDLTHLESAIRWIQNVNFARLRCVPATLPEFGGLFPLLHTGLG